MTIDYDQAVRRHLIDLVHHDGRLAALIGMVPKPDHLFVGNVAVCPDLQRRGLGRRLLRHAETVAATLGLTELRLYTNARFEENVRLYERAGYRISGDEPIPAGGARLHMRKRLPDAD